MGRALWIGLVALVGCAAPPPTFDDGPGMTPRRPPQPRAPGYEVHEWGLIRALGGGADAVSLSGTAPPTRHDYPMEKPVLYFHADGPLHLDRVTVSTPDAEILEVWPIPATRSTSSVTWTDVALHPGECAETALPSDRDPPCAGLSSLVECESKGLAVVRAPSALCVETGAFRDRFLFYRALSAKFAPPLRFTRVGNGGEVEVRNVGASVIPGVLVRIIPGDTNATTVIAVPPAPGESITVGVTGVEDLGSAQGGQGAWTAGPGPTALRLTLRDLGLDDDEADAFLHAWVPTLFDAPDLVMGERAVVRARPSFVYFLPQPMVDGMAKLEMEPPPRAVKRAFAVWATLPE